MTPGDGKKRPWERGTLCPWLVVISSPDFAFVSRMRNLEKSGDEIRLVATDSEWNYWKNTPCGQERMTLHILES